MLTGCYYRCPIPIEEQDREHPRFFVLAQLKRYSEMSGMAEVEMYDLLGSKKYYGEILKINAFSAESIHHCRAIQGGIVLCKYGTGKITEAVNPEAEDEPYWYFVKLQDGRYVKLCETELKIEYTQMDCSPVNQLLNYEFQHPSWFINHLKVSRNQHLANHAFYGFSVLAGCRVYLLPHQISTVARCLETTPVRYMLADEVGLGKTVEACSILKILMSDNMDFKTLIIVPSALMGQWKNELYYKYSLETGTENICLLVMEDLPKCAAVYLKSWDMVIVDETHRLLLHPEVYQCVQTVSHRAANLLLLSATPIQARSEEYRKLLALLAPDFYGPMSEQEFAGLVKKQQKIQKSVNQQLGRLNRYGEYSETIIARLHSISETLGDKKFHSLVQTVDASSEDGGLEAVTAALSYICENYRVERRVIRNRRQIIHEEMAERTLAELPYEQLTADETYNESGAVQAVLSYLTNHSDESEKYIIETAVPLLNALFSSPWALEAMLSKLGIDDALLWDSTAAWKKQAVYEHRMVTEALDENPDLIKGRLMKILDYLEQETDVLTDSDCKIVVFTGFTETLREFVNIARPRMESAGIGLAAFSKEMSRSELEDSVYAFQNDPDCRIIVCDETGGEGRNFQNASLLIHIDLPWNANMLEQRIGRLDRLGRDPDKKVQSVVIYAENSVEAQLFSIWKDGMKLFERSLSGLEIITGELNQLIIDALMDNFYTGLANSLDDIMTEAEEMRESVEDEQLFDLGATLYRPLAQGVDQVLELYKEGSSNLFSDAMIGWSRQAGLEPEPPTKDGLIEFKQSKFSPRAAMQSLFIPPDWTYYQFTSIMRRTGKIIGSFDRKTAAIREDINFFAPGDPVYDAIIANAAGCSRGRCAAVSMAGRFNYDGLVYIYNVEASAKELLEDGMGLQTLAQYRMYLPLNQIIIPIGLTSASKNVPAEKVIDRLITAEKASVNHLGRRGHSRFSSSPLEDFIQKNPPDIWESLVRACTDTAYKRALIAMREQSDLETAKSEMLRIINGYKSECLYFGRSKRIAEEKAAVYRAVYRALKAARPVLDAVCFIRVRKYG